MFPCLGNVCIYVGELSVSGQWVYFIYDDEIKKLYVVEELVFSIWDSKIPQEIHEKFMHRVRVRVWYGFRFGGIIGHYFSERRQEMRFH